MRKILTLLIIPCLAIAEPVNVQLKTGEMVSGELVELGDETVTLHSEALGKIEVPLEQLTEETLDSLEASLDEPADGPEVETAAPREQTWYQLTVGRFIPEEWTGDLRFGYHFVRTSSRRNEVQARARANRRVGPHEFETRGFYEYGRERNELDEVRRVLDKWGGLLTHSYDLDERWFIGGEAAYLTNAIQQIDHQVDLASFFGYRILNRDDLALSIAPGPSVRYLEAEGENDDWFMLASIRQDFRYQWSRDLRFRQAFVGSMRPEDSEEYSIRFEGSLIFRLTEWAETALSYENEYSTFVGEDGVRREERLLVSIVLPF